MLEVQKYLEDNTHADLERDLGVKASFHDSEPLVILNYSQIDSPKTHAIVRECRGLVLHSETHELVARGFPRFFNWGEVQEEMGEFDWSDFHVQTKEDGSFVLLFHWGGKWRMSTRRSFGEKPIDWHPITWQQGVLAAFGEDCLQSACKHLDPSLTYVCEFCSPWNKVVREYQTPRLYLLAAFDGERELTQWDLFTLGPIRGIWRSTWLPFSEMEDIQRFLKGQQASDPTYEGVVIRDCNNLRFKIKSPTYLGLHRMKGEPGTIYSPKHLLPFVMTGETDELLTYFREARPAVEFYQEQYEQMKSGMLSAWSAHKDEPDQKTFALAIKEHPLRSVLFTARKTGRDPLEVLRESDGIVLKNLSPFNVFPQLVG